jgi:hypothetical protein
VLSAPTHLLGSSSHNRPAPDEQKPAQDRRNHPDRNQDPESHRKRSDSEYDHAIVISGCTPYSLDHSRFCRGLFQAIWVLQRLLAHPPRPFPLGRGARLGAVLLSTPSLPSHEHFTAKEFSLAGSLRSSFSASFTRELSAMGRRAELHQASVKVATRPKKQKPETVRSRF